jgi:hypothetical protein
VQVLQDSKAKEIYFSLVIFVFLGKTSFINTRLDGKLKQGFCLKINLWKNRTLTNDNDTSSLTMNNAKSFSNYFGWGSFFE